MQLDRRPGAARSVALLSTHLKASAERGSRVGWLLIVAAARARRARAEAAQARKPAGMRLGLHDRLDQGDGRRADLPGLAHHPRRRPLGVAPMRARHVLANRRMAVAHIAARMARNPAAPVEELDGRIGEARLDLLTDQARRAPSSSGRSTST